MSPVRAFTVADRRSRLGRRHRLADPGTDVAGITEDLVVLHATDPATVYLSAMARVAGSSLDQVASALYEERSVVRILAMRRTLFIVPVCYLPVIERSSTDPVATVERARLEGFLADSDIDDPVAWLAEAATEVTDALTDGGAQAREITALVPRLATKIVMGAGTKWAATAGATSRVLATLANEGVLIRGRPAGEWTGRQYTWHLRRRWLGESEPAPDSYTLESASTELVRRWLLAFGPATFDDLKWWTGWKVGQLRSALAELDVAEVELDGGSGIVLGDDLDDDPAPEPWAALLPSLDPTPMGWKERDWYLGPHRGSLFDRNGNVGPTVWVNGRIVGGWGQRPDGQVVTRLLVDDIDTHSRALIEAEVTRLQDVVGDTVVKPSFPTPLQRELST